MKRMKRVLIPLSVVAVFIALVMANRSFAQVGSQKSSDPAQSQAGSRNNAQKGTSDKDVVIGYLKGRDSVVTISRGPEGTIYTIKDKKGKTLDAKLSEKELQAKYPEIYDQVKYGLAGNDASLRKEINRYKGVVK